MGFKKILVSLALAASLSFVSASKANAQFAVFDGMSYGQLVLQLRQGLQLYQNAVQLYGIASQEATYLRNKQVLLAVGFLAQQAQMPGQPGWNQALTTASGLSNAATVWKQMSASSVNNNLQALSNRLKLADSFGSSSVNSLGSCTAASVSNNNAIGLLEHMATNTSQLFNTADFLSGLKAMSQAQQSRANQCTQALQQQQLQMQLLQAAAQRDQDQSLYNMRSTDQAVRTQITTSNTVNDINNLTDR